jgi:hypothetical protein
MQQRWNQRPSAQEDHSFRGCINYPSSTLLNSKQLMATDAYVFLVWLPSVPVVDSKILQTPLKSSITPANSRKENKIDVCFFICWLPVAEKQQFMKTRTNDADLFRQSASLFSRTWRAGVLDEADRGHGLGTW